MKYLGKKPPVLSFPITPETNHFRGALLEAVGVLGEIESGGYPKTYELQLSLFSKLQALRRSLRVSAGEEE